MSDAEDLAQAFHAALTSRSDSPTWDWSELSDKHREWKVAAAQDVLNAGWAKRRRIPVPSDLDHSPELDACPDGTVLFDGDEDVMVKWDGVWRFWGVDYEDDDEPGTVCLPAVVVHYPAVAIEGTPQ